MVQNWLTYDIKIMLRWNILTKLLIEWQQIWRNELVEQTSKGGNENQTKKSWGWLHSLPKLGVQFGCQGFSILRNDDVFCFKKTLLQSLQDFSLHLLVWENFCWLDQKLISEKLLNDFFL